MVRGGFCNIYRPENYQGLDVLGFRCKLPLGATLTGSEFTESLENFCRNPWEFQQTFETPLKDLQSFVKTIVFAGWDMQTASLTIDRVVFEPKDLIQMLTSHSIPLTCKHGLFLMAVGQYEIEELLRIALSEWIDFLFIPEPHSFVIYADHDEYTTFYAHDRSQLDRMVRVLSAQGFKRVANYERRF
jgi:hypothetical protein